MSGSQVIPAMAVVAIFVICCALARELMRDFYRPWLERRHAAERAEQREITTWIAAMRGISASACSMAYSVQSMTDAMHKISAASALVTIPTRKEAAE